MYKQPYMADLGNDNLIYACYGLGLLCSVNRGIEIYRISYSCIMI